MPVAAAAMIGAFPAGAVEPRTVQRFISLSDRFHAQLPNSRIRGFSSAQKRERAVCILSRFEQSHGRDGVQALMNLMNVLSRGTEFDDPTVVSFNNRFGGDYNRTVAQCTRAARNS